VHYVKSMDELLVEASEYAARDVRAKMLDVEELPNPLEALRGVLYLALASDADKRGNWNFFLGFWERSVHNAAVRAVTHLRWGMAEAPVQADPPRQGRAGGRGCRCDARRPIR
jgi:hypothetical protein